MDISRWVAHRADWSPGRVAVHFGEASATYAELELRVGRVAGALRDELGIRPGDRVAYLGLNSPELLAALFACARLGAILLPLNWRLAAAEHAWMLRHADPALILVEPDFEEAIERVLADLPRLRAIRIGSEPCAPARWPHLAALVNGARPASPGSGGELRSPVLLVYTSGTTGHPKGAVLTQEALLYNALNSIAALDMTSGDHVLTVLPMFHVGGLNIQTTPAIHAGAAITIARRFDAGQALALIAARRPTLFLTVPTVAQAIASHPAFPRTDLSCLRCMTTGSSIVPETVVRPWLDRGIPVTQVYGLTESGPTAIALSIADAARKPTSCGKAALYCEARVVDPDGSDLRAGERGEIQLRGPNLISGYWNDPEATARAFTDGWFHTGDIGHRDGEGHFYVDDRKTDVVISGGENIYPAELEAVLAESPDIAEAAVVGRADARWGEVPVACVVPRPGAAVTREDVIALFRDRIARYKHPRDVVFLEALPRTALGKIQKFELRRRLAAGASIASSRPAGLPSQS
jgi:fatty-acyl-CoA synthase